MKIRKYSAMPLLITVGVAGAVVAPPPADTTAPVLVSATIGSSGLVLSLLYGEALNASSVPSTAAFTIAGGRGTASAVSIAGSTVSITLSAATLAGDTVTVSYTPGASPIKDAAGNVSAALSSVAATNNSTASAAFVPTDISNMLVWQSAAATTDTGNGTAVSACTDQSPAGVSIVESGSGLGPIRRDAAGRRGSKVLEYASTTKWMKSLASSGAGAAALCALRTGAAKDFTLFWVWQPTSSNTSYLGGWGITTTYTQYFVPFMTALKLQLQFSDPTNQFQTAFLDATAKGLSAQVMAVVHDATAHTLQLWIDGIAVGSPVAFPWASGASSDNYTYGGYTDNGTDTVSSYFNLSHHVVYGKKCTAGEIQNFTDWGATQIGDATVGLKWKKGTTQSTGFGNGSGSTLILGVTGDSQNTAYSTSGTYTSIYAGGAQQAYAMFPDGNVAPMTGTPLVDPTNAVGLAQDSASSGTVDCWTRLTDALRAGGVTKNILVGMRGLGSGLADGTSGVRWNLNLNSVPPVVNEAYGSMCYYIDELIRNARSPELFFFHSYGAAHAASPAYLGATVANLFTGMTSILDALNTRYAGFFTKTQHHAVFVPPVTPAVGYEANWSAMRAGFASWAAGRSDVILIQNVDGPFDAVNTHLQIGSNTAGSETGKMKMGLLGAAGYFAAV